MAVSREGVGGQKGQRREYKRAHRSNDGALMTAKSPESMASCGSRIKLQWKALSGADVKKQQQGDESSSAEI